LNAPIMRLRFSSMDIRTLRMSMFRAIFAAHGLLWRELYEAGSLGFRVHSGWTSLVAISLDSGSPEVLLRERPHLVKTFTYEFCQPYHTAKMKPPIEARSFIMHMRTEARTLASRVIHVVGTDLRAQGYELKCCGILLASGKPLPDLPRILDSHALIHTADGELFREALLHAGKRCGIETFTAKKREVLESSVRALHLQPEELSRCLTDLGRPIGSPWSQDEKFSALVAWLSLL
jgi:hypothetical protein